MSPSKKKPTLQDIADICGVSIATVSMALTGKGNISDEMREKISETARSIGYTIRRVRPKYAAVLYSGYPFQTAFIGDIINAISGNIMKEDIFPVLFPIPVARNLNPSQLFNKIKTSGADFIFSIHCADDSLFEKLEGIDKKVVMVNNGKYQNRFFSVLVDDFEGTYSGTLQLIKNRHKNILYINYDRLGYHSATTDRFLGFKKAIDEYNLHFPDKNKITLEISEPEQFTLHLREAFEGPEKPTAVYADDDYLALHILQSLSTLGLQVPEDVSLICTGGTIDFDLPNMPDISTMHINTALLGDLASKLMIERIAGDHSTRHSLKVSMQFRDRGSIKRL